jgi:hypothetical protein
MLTIIGMAASAIGMARVSAGRLSRSYDDAADRKSGNEHEKINEILC